MRSLRSRLFLLWTLSLAASLAVGILLVGLYRQSSSAQFATAAVEAAQGCQDIAERYGFYAAGWAGPEPSGGAAEADFVRDLTVLIDVAIDGHAGLAGGIWDQDRGGLASSVAVPPAVAAALATLTAAVAEGGTSTGARVEDNGATLLLAACPLRGPVVGLTAWTMARVASAPGVTQLRLGLGVLLLLALGMAGLLTWLVAAWGRRIGGIERALAEHAAGTLRIAPTGERELDRIVAALNLAGSRLAAMQARSDELAARVALSERLAALGRVAAGVAHEIRNPIAAIRIRAENALVGDDARRRTALETILAQVGRLDRLIGELLAMTTSRAPQPVATDIVALLQGCAEEHRPAPVEIVVIAGPATCLLDGAMLRRVLDNLLQNALHHTPEGGRITLRATCHDGALHMEVADTGPGVPAALRDTLFEPFVTGRPEGTGLGLAIARELVQAQGGRIALRAGGAGAVFTVDLPCPAS